MYKQFIQIYIPAVSSLYFIVSAIVGLPFTVEVIGTLAIVETFLGIRITNKAKHYDGQMIVVEKTEGGKLFSLQLNGDPEELEEKDSVSFKVVLTPK